MPPKFTTKMRYSENIALDPGVLSASTFVYRAGSLYDPNFTGAGHQPRGFDEIMPLYGNYTVIGSKMTVTWTSTSGELYNQLVGVALLNQSTATDVNSYMENGIRSYRTIHPQKPTAITKMTYSPRKMLGVSKPLSEKDLAGSQATNPARESFYHLFSFGLDSNDPVGVDATINIDYIVVFTNPKLAIQS